MRTTRVLAALTGVAAAIGLAGPAQAARWHTADPDDPIKTADISQVRVVYAPHRVATKVWFHQPVRYDRVTIYYDTRPRHRGAEFALVVTSEYALFRRHHSDVPCGSAYRRPRHLLGGRATSLLQDQGTRAAG